MKIQQFLVAGAALCVSPALATLAAFSPASGINYAVGIPSSTRNAGSGDIFISVSFPATYQWVGIGIGTHMAGASLFVAYADGNGNVTVSPRDGKGETMPFFDPSKEVTILGGSKADSDTVVANFRYKATAAELESQSSTAPWIGSFKTGPALNSTDKQVPLQHHDGHKMYTLNLASADVGTSSNPFLGDSGSSSSSPNSSPNSSPSGSPGASAGGVTDGTSFSDEESTWVKFEKAHGSLMGVAWLVVFPIGAIMMRMRWGGVWAHAAVMMLGTAMIIAGFGVGRSLAEKTGLLFNNTHTLLGACIFGLILVQPFLGLYHHYLYKQKARRTLFGTLHCWYGRAIMILAAVNGGLGLQMAGNTNGGEIAWGVVAGVAALVYLAASGFSLRKKKPAPEAVAAEKSEGEGQASA